MRTDSTSLTLFRHHIVEVFMRRTASTSLRSLTVSPSFLAPPAVFAQLLESRGTSFANRSRPHHGGSHERRIPGTPTCHYAPSRRPSDLVYLPGAGPHRGLVSQVVAPLPRGRRRGPVRLDPGTPGGPAHPARVGEGDPLRSPAAPGPRHAGHALPPDRGYGHPSRTQGPWLPPPAQPAHHRARAPAQRPDRTPRPPRSLAAASGVPRPASPGLQRTARGRPRGAGLPPGQRSPLLYLDLQRYLRRGRVPAFGLFPQDGRGPVLPRRVLEGSGPAGASATRQRPRAGGLGAGGTNPVAGDPAVPALRRQPGVHPGRGAAVQRQRGEFQRLVPRAVVPTALPPAGRPAAGTGPAAGGRQYPARASAAAGPDAGATSSGPAAAEVAGEFHRADGAVAADRGARDLPSAGEPCRDGHGVEPIVPGGKEASRVVPAAGGRHRAWVADRVPERPRVETLALQTPEQLTDT